MPFRTHTIISSSVDSSIQKDSKESSSDQCGCVRAQKILTCYSPTNANGNVSCVLSKGIPRVSLTTNDKLAMLPENAILDSVEFFGTNDFVTKEPFTVGLSQGLNGSIVCPLIEQASCEYARAPSGGYRQFLFMEPDGKSTRVILPTENFVNVSFEAPVQNGYLQIVIRYHMKITKDV